MTLEILEKIMEYYEKKLYLQLLLKEFNNFSCALELILYLETIVFLNDFTQIMRLLKSQWEEMFKN